MPIKFHYWDDPSPKFDRRKPGDEGIGGLFFIVLTIGALFGPAIAGDIESFISMIMLLACGCVLISMLSNFLALFRFRRQRRGRRPRR